MTPLRRHLAALCAALVLWPPVTRLLSLWESRGPGTFSGNSATGSRGWGGPPGMPRFGNPAPGSIDQDIRSHTVGTGFRATDRKVVTDTRATESRAAPLTAKEVLYWPYSRNADGSQIDAPRAATREQESPYSEQGHIDEELIPYRHVGPAGCGKLALLYDGVLDVYRPMLLRSERARLPDGRRPVIGSLITCASCRRAFTGLRDLERIETAEGWRP